MTGHLYLHIGPPKSGTTSLQHTFERIQHPRFVYGGVYQPRERNRGTLANRLDHALQEGEQNDGNAIQEKNKRSRHCGEACVISEEVLLVNQRKGLGRRGSCY